MVRDSSISPFRIEQPAKKLVTMFSSKIEVFKMMLPKLIYGFHFNKINYKQVYEHNVKSWEERCSRRLIREKEMWLSGVDCSLIHQFPWFSLNRLLSPHPTFTGWISQDSVWWSDGEPCTPHTCLSASYLVLLFISAEHYVSTFK